MGYLVWQATHTPGRLLSPRLVKLPDGRSLKLERYEFQAGTVRYELPDWPLARALESVLPRPLRQRFSWLKPESVDFESPTFPGERLLSVEVQRAWLLRWPVGSFR